jgi:hypothetical protein
MKNKLVILGVLALFIFINPALSFGQEEAVQLQGAQELRLEPEMQWIWGEVVAINTLKKELTIKYLDYETDQEKEMAVLADENTTYENAKSLEEIRVGDTAGIDYVDLDGELLAKNISLEKPEPANPQGEIIGQPVNSGSDLTPQDLNRTE